MKNKNLLILGLGYLAGMFVFAKFNKKDPAELKKAIHKSGNFFDSFFDNFVQIHKDLFYFLEENIFSKENIKKFSSYKDKFVKQIEGFEEEALEKVEELKKMGIKKEEEIEKEIKKLYNKRMEYFNKAKDLGEDYMELGKKKLEKVLKEIKKSLK